MTETEPQETGKSASLVAAGIGLSRITGLLREMLLAYTFGSRAIADAMTVAFRIPNLLQNLLGEGVLSASFIPVYAQLLEEDRKKEAAKVAGAVAGSLMALAGALSLLGALAARPLTRLLQPGLVDDRVDLAVPLVRIVFLSMGFLVLSAWCLGILNSHRKFFLSYFAPVMWNGAQIAVLVVLYLNSWSDISAAEAVAWALVVGGVLQLAIQLPTVIRVGGPIRPTLRAGHEKTREVRRRFGPAIISRGAVQISAFADLAFASWLAVGALSGLRFAQVLYLLPISLFAMSVAAAELPELSRAGNSKPDEVSERLNVGLRRIAFYVSFTALAYILAGDLLVAAILQHGDEFTRDSTLLVWAILATYSLGLIPVSLSRLLQNACWALGDVKGPTKLTIIRFVVAAIFGVMLMFTFDQLLIFDGNITGLAEIKNLRLYPLSEVLRTADGLPLRLGAMGLALGSAIGIWVEYFLLRRKVAAKLGRTKLSPRLIVELAPALLLAAILMIALRIATDPLSAVLAAPITIGVSGLAYVGLAAKLRSSAATELKNTFTRRLGRHG